MPQRGTAIATEQTAHSTCRVVVVDVQVALLLFPTNGTGATLLQEKYVMSHLN